MSAFAIFESPSDIPLEPARPESVLLPPPLDLRPSETERKSWRALEFEAFKGRCSAMFQQLLVLLILSILPNTVRWDSRTLRRLFSPDISPRGPRLKVLQDVMHMTQKLQQHPRFSMEELRSFLQPILPPQLPHGWFEQQFGFQSTAFPVVMSVLDHLGIPEDEATVLRRRTLIVSALPSRRQESPLAALAITAQHLVKLQDELGDTVDPSCLAVIAFGRSKGGATFLQHYSQTSEGDSLVMHAVQSLDNAKSHKVRLALLLTCYFVHVHAFGTGDYLEQAPYLPAHLSRRGLFLYQEAVTTYARTFGLIKELYTFAPEFKQFDSGSVHLWNDFWNLRYPPPNIHWENPRAAPEALPQIIDVWDPPAEVSHFDDSPDSWTEAVSDFFSGCFGSLKLKFRLKK